MGEIGLYVIEADMRPCFLAGIHAGGGDQIAERSGWYMARDPFIGSHHGSALSQ